MTTPLGSRRNPILILGEGVRRKRPVDVAPEQSSQKRPINFKIEREEDTPKRPIKAEEQILRPGSMKVNAQQGFRTAATKVKEEPSFQKESTDVEADQSSRKRSINLVEEHRHTPSDYSGEENSLLEEFKLKRNEIESIKREWSDKVWDHLIAPSGPRKQTESHHREKDNAPKGIREQMEEMSRGHTEAVPDPTVQLGALKETIEKMRKDHSRAVSDLTTQLDASKERMEKMSRDHSKEVSDLTAQLEKEKSLKIGLSSANAKISAMRREDRGTKRKHWEKENKLQRELAEARRQRGTIEDRLEELQYVSRERDEANVKIQNMKLEYWEREGRMKVEMEEAKKHTEVMMEGRYQEEMNQVRLEIYTLRLRFQELQDILQALEA